MSGESSRSSWSSQIYSNRCKCGLNVAMRMSWTGKKNPSRRFINCPKSRYQKCDLWNWIDPEAPARYKFVINDLYSQLEKSKEDSGNNVSEVEKLSSEVNDLNEKVRKLKRKNQMLTWENYSLKIKMKKTSKN